MFALVPVFALLTSLVTRSVRRNYPQHLYFALHIHAAVFALLVIGMLVRSGHSELMDGVADVIVLALVPGYLVAAFRTAYGGTWRLAVGRAAFVATVYAIAITAALAVVVVMALFV